MRPFSQSCVLGSVLTLAFAARLHAARGGADFDADGFDDLVVGMPVNIIYGTSAGLSGSGAQSIHQNTPGIVDESESNDHYGAAL